MNIHLHGMDTSFASYQHLVDFAHICNSVKGNVNVHFPSWFAANMSSPLGAILSQVQINGCTVQFTNADAIFQKNGFLTHFGYPSSPDINRTTIKYMRLKRDDARSFHEFIRTALIEHPNLPHLSSGLKKKIQEAIFEIFVNAQTHSGVSDIFTCGQFFPTKHKIEFTITDMGNGFRENFKSRFGQDIFPEKAIEWAMVSGNTTKIGVPGGIGLAILKEFAVKNDGKIQIVSDAGFYQWDAKGQHLNRFSRPFPGTIVNVQFRTNDPHSYSLVGEASTEDIF